MNNLGSVYTDLQRYEEAETFFNRALSIQKEVLGNEHDVTCVTMNNLGYINLLIFCLTYIRLSHVSSYCDIVTHKLLFQPVYTRIWKDMKKLKDSICNV
jgi:hypothetical protein